MSDCRRCAASITWAVNEKGEKVPLDDHEQLDYGPGRYRIKEDGNPALVAPVADDSAIRTFVDHRVICQRPRPM